MGVGRFYFRSEQGVVGEMKDHPLNGAHFEGTGPWVVRDGEMVKGEREYITIFTGNKTTEGYPETRRITVDDFGGKVVTVVQWFPNPRLQNTFRLVPALTQEQKTAIYTRMSNMGQARLIATFECEKSEMGWAERAMWEKEIAYRNSPEYTRQ